MVTGAYERRDIQRRLEASSIRVGYPEPAEAYRRTIGQRISKGPPTVLQLVASLSILHPLCMLPADADVQMYNSGGRRRRRRRR